MSLVEGANSGRSYQLGVGQVLRRRVQHRGTTDQARFLVPATDLQFATYDLRQMTRHTPGHGTLQRICLQQVWCFVNGIAVAVANAFADDYDRPVLPLQNAIERS